METEYLRLIKIDHDNNCVEVENIDEQENVRDYVMAIIEQISENAGDREYRFKAEEITMKTYLRRLTISSISNGQICYFPIVVKIKSSTMSLCAISST